jgi:hypothetical protein
LKREVLVESVPAEPSAAGTLGADSSGTRFSGSLTFIVSVDDGDGDDTPGRISK